MFTIPRIPSVYGRITTTLTGLFVIFLSRFFKENAEGTYDRFEECGRERMYTLRSLCSYLKQTGFELIGVYKDFAFSEGTDGDERLYIAAKCIKNTEET